MLVNFLELDEVQQDLEVVAAVVSLVEKPAVYCCLVELSNFSFIFLFNLLPELNYSILLEPRMLQASVSVVQVPHSKCQEFHFTPSYLGLMLLRLDSNAFDHCCYSMDALVDFIVLLLLLGFQMFLLISEPLAHYS